MPKVTESSSVHGPIDTETIHRHQDDTFIIHAQSGELITTCPQGAGTTAVTEPTTMENKESERDGKKYGG